MFAQWLRELDGESLTYFQSVEQK